MEGWTARTLELVGEVEGRSDSYLEWEPTRSAACFCKAMVFPVVMYGCESWTVKKAERHRIDAFELWCWRSRRPWF